MLGTCCSCGWKSRPVLDLGSQIPADFVDPGDPFPDPYPLNLALCANPECALLQLDDLTPRSLLYHERYGFRSGTNEAIRADLADVVLSALGVVRSPERWLDIACNDGTLLSMVPPHVHRTGIDPLTAYGSFWESAEKSADRVIGDFYSPDYFKTGEFDVITSVSMFYDLADPGQFVQGVRESLGTHGVWVIQQNYALDLLRLNAVDNVCHEHVTYFSVRALKTLLESYGLEINDVSYSTVNGGCFRTIVSHRGRREVRSSVGEALRAEAVAGLHAPATFMRWGEAVRKELDLTREKLESIRSTSSRAYLYGAGTRVGTILQMIGAGPGLLPYAVDRHPGKVGKVMASCGIPIISEEVMRADAPEYLLVSPWFFRDVFLRRERAFLQSGGCMIFPLPAFEVVGA